MKKLGINIYYYVLAKKTIDGGFTKTYQDNYLKSWDLRRLYTFPSMYINNFMGYEYLQEGNPGSDLRSKTKPYSYAEGKGFNSKTGVDLRPSSWKDNKKK